MRFNYFKILLVLGLLTFNTCKYELNENYIKPCTLENDCKCGEPIIDSRNGEVYETVWIDSLGGNDSSLGGQCWLKRNLAYGELISSIHELEPLNPSKTQRFYDEDSPISIDNVGGYYTFGEATYDNLDPRSSICPSGWKIPSEEDWQFLKKSIECNSNLITFIGGNETGFDGLKLGYFRTGTQFDSVVTYGTTMNYWSTTPGQMYSGLQVYFRVEPGGEILIREDGVGVQTNGLCIRCIKE